jgi:hypothetical protein
MRIVRRAKVDAVRLYESRALVDFAILSSEILHGEGNEAFTIELAHEQARQIHPGDKWDFILDRLERTDGNGS